MPAKRVLVSIGVDVDAVAGWYESCGFFSGLSILLTSRLIQAWVLWRGGLASRYLKGDVCGGGRYTAPLETVQKI
jgi:hypothetical protein